MNEQGREFWQGALSLSPAAQKWHTVHGILSPYDDYRCDISLFVYACDHALTLIDCLRNLIEAMDVVGKSFEIVMIDDHSADRTSELAHGFMAEFPDIPMILRTNLQHKGVAQNFIDAAFIGCGKYFRMMSADNAEPVETTVDILKSMGDADIIVPYYVGSSFSGLEATRASDWRTRIINLLSGNYINYYAASHMHLRYNVMRWHANTEGPYFQADLLCRLLEVGFTIKQVPCRARPSLPSEIYAGSMRSFGSFMHTLTDLLFRRMRAALH